MGKERDMENDDVGQDGIDVEPDDTVTGKEHENDQKDTETTMVHDDEKIKDNENTKGDEDSRVENMENTTKQVIEENEVTGPTIQDRENAFESDTEDGTLTEITRITRTKT